MSTVNEQADLGNDSKDRLAADLESLKASFGQLRTDLTQLINSAMGVSKSGAAATRDVAANAVDGLKGRLNGLKEKGVNSAQAAEDKLSEHPLATLVVAFGAGFVVAKILSRR